MSDPERPGAFPAVANLPRTPASALKMLGWRGMMKALRSRGKLLVTNHDEPEAVILPVADYEAMLRLLERSEVNIEAALATLRRGFDERVSVLQARSAASRLRSTIRGRAKLGGRLKAGSGY